ncbi:hypothetical protein SVXHr_2333 [Halorhabdus sp. SVX81]|uniref:hypothetical protein n=1 Tax=Halorhabdus sp. SVX81 TaxID=2978283 RepID=UPI0023DACFF9|nr:hypothetical protein [Halorhabdus sp. SVX81]WEL18483.1 hypothetical protein SVXHr_2333 [Halorhabdus sp. SVX81]
MTNQDWAKLLKYLYENQGLVYVTEHLTDENELINERFFDELRDKIEFSEEMQSDAVFASMLSHLERIEVISWEQEGTSSTLILESKGFDIAHEREINKGQQELNASLVILTIGIFIATLMQAASSIVSLEGTERLTMLIFGVVTLLLLLWALYRSKNEGIFELP